MFFQLRETAKKQLFWGWEVIGLQLGVISWEFIFQLFDNLFFKIICLSLQCGCSKSIKNVFLVTAFICVAQGFFLTLAISDAALGQNKRLATSCRLFPIFPSFSVSTFDFWEYQRVLFFLVLFVATHGLLFYEFIQTHLKLLLLSPSITSCHSKLQNCKKSTHFNLF